MNIYIKEINESISAETKYGYEFNEYGFIFYKEVVDIEDNKTISYKSKCIIPWNNINHITGLEKDKIEE